MNWRRITFFARGALFLRPIPDHGDLRAWLSGQAFACWVVVASIPIVLVGIGFAAGRYF